MDVKDIENDLFKKDSENFFQLYNQENRNNNRVIMIYFIYN